ncbi:MAG: universal stress protein [Bdellovibrionales bacterium]
MKTAVLAIDATRDTAQTIENLARGLIRFQNVGLLENVHVVSVMHPDSYLLPYSYYRDQKYHLAEQSKLELAMKLDPELKVSSVEILVTDGQAMEDHVVLLDRFAHSVEADVLVVGTNEKSTLSYLVQGSFAEAASLGSSLPVLVFGGAAGHARIGQPPTILVALSPTARPSPRLRRQIVNLAGSLRANISLLPVNDQSQWFSFDRDLDNKSAEAIRREFVMEGTLSVKILTNEPVLPGRVPSIVDQRQALLTVFCSTPETLRKPWFLPSLNGRVIAEMSRPILLLKETMRPPQFESRKRDDMRTSDREASELNGARQRANQALRLRADLI